MNKEITIRFSIFAVIMAASGLLLSAYAAWELYWMHTVGYAAIKWHTHLALYIYIAYGWLIWIWVLHKRAKAIRWEAVAMAGSVLACLMMIEALLVLTGIGSTYMERASGYYRSVYEPLSASYYYTWDVRGKEHILHKPEFTYIRPTNSDGFGDEDWDMHTSGGQIRIMALGDSFTEGDGAPFDSSYVALMRRLLRTDSSQYYVMNAGICGSDPVYNYILLKDRLLKYKPDIIIQSWASNDLNMDMLVRGGMERFQKDGTVKFRQAPGWEPIYAVSNIARLIFSAAGYTELLLKKDMSPKDIEWVNSRANELNDAYTKICHAAGVKLVIVLHPTKNEIENGRYDYDMTPLLRHIALYPDVSVVDLLPAYRHYLDSTHTTVDQYFWKVDGHHNATGYRMMAITTLNAISPLLSDTGTTAGHKSLRTND